MRTIIAISVSLSMLSACVTVGGNGGSNIQPNQPVAGEKRTYPDVFTITVPSDLVPQGYKGIQNANLWSSKKDERYTGTFDEKNNTLQSSACWGVNASVGFLPVLCGKFNADIVSSKRGSDTVVTIKNITYDPNYVVSSINIDRALFGRNFSDKVDIKDLSEWLYSHTAQKIGELYIPYQPEAVKANYDRKLQRSKEGPRDAAQKQFSAWYVVTKTSSTTITAGMNFSPNKNGTVIDYTLRGSVNDSAKSNLRSVDWAEGMREATKEIERIGKL